MAEGCREISPRLPAEGHAGEGTGLRSSSRPQLNRNSLLSLLCPKRIGPVWAARDCQVLRAALRSAAGRGVVRFDRVRRLIKREGTLVRARAALSTTLILCVSILAPAWGQDLQLHFISVWQADGALLVSPRGETVLFDTGVAWR